MIFAARGILISLAFLAAAYCPLSLLVVMGWRGAKHVGHASTANTANLLFGLRIFPVPRPAHGDDFSKLFLESEFRSELNQAWSRRADDLSKMRVIVHLAIHRSGPVELGMVEHVECLNPELERL